MADNFGLKIGVEGEKEFKKALREINQEFKVLGSEMKLVTSQFDKQDNSVQAVTARKKVLTKEIDEQKEKIDLLEKALKNSSDSFGQTDSRTKAWAVQLNHAKAELNDMERELDKNNTALGEAEQGFASAGESAGEFGGAVEESAERTEKAGGSFEKIGGVLKGIGVAVGAAIIAIGTAAVAASVSLVKLGDEYNQAVNQISASTGATGAELEALGAVARNVYKKNFGESMADVAEGLSVVKKTTGLWGAELEKATESGFALRDTFGFEMQESARAAGALMKNFGVSAEQAYNIIAVGAQNGADKNGDLLDTLNEYSAQYSALGLSADQFIASLISGADAGVFSIDKVGDAVKEFNIRAKDGSVTTTQAFAALGMNADDMMRRFASGGADAQAAFFEVVRALNTMEDPLAKNNAAVALFGTMYEDLEANVLPVLSSMADGAQKNYDALSQINKIKYNDLDTAIEGTKRSLQGVFLPVVSEVSAGITGVFSTLGNAINEANGDFEQIAAAIGTAIGDVADIIVEKMPMFLELGLNIVMAIGGAIIENLPMLIESAVNTVMTLLIALIEALPRITEAAVTLVLTLVQGIIANLPALVEAAIQMIVTLATGLADSLPELIPSIVEAIILIVQVLIQNMPKILDAALKIIQGLAQGLLNALPKLVEALPKIITAIIDFIVNNLPKIIEMGISLTVQLAVGLIQAIPQLVKAIPQIISAIIDGLGKALSAVWEIGKNIVTGLWNGIQSMASWIKSKVSDFVGGIVSGIKGVLGIRSPSTVFAGIGGHMAEGLGVGFMRAMDGIRRDMYGAIPTDFDVDARLGIQGRPGGTPGGTTIHQSISVVTPKALSERELSRELKNLSRKLALEL